MSLSKDTKPRARNTATDEQVQKLLRSNLTNLGTAYKETDMELIVAGYESFICDFLNVSPRLVAKQLGRCAGRVFEKESSVDVDMFARQVAYSLSYVRTKMKAVTSGKKTHPAIKRVCECLQKLDAELQQDRLSSLRKRVHSPDRSTRSAGNLQDGSCIARNLDRQQQQLQGCPACTCACRGDRTRRGGFRIVGLEGHHVAVLLQGFLQVHHSDGGRHFKAASCV